MTNVNVDCRLLINNPSIWIVKPLNLLGGHESTVCKRTRKEERAKGAGVRESDYTTTPGKLSDALSLVAWCPVVSAFFDGSHDL